MLGALELLISGAAGMAKAVSDSKVTRRQLEELRRHNHAMEICILLHKNMKKDYISTLTNVDRA